MEMCKDHRLQQPLLALIIIRLDNLQTFKHTIRVFMGETHLNIRQPSMGVLAETQITRKILTP